VVELVNLDTKDGERDAELGEGVKTLMQMHLGVFAIRDAGDRVKAAMCGKVVFPPVSIGKGTLVVEAFGGSNDIAQAVPERHRVQAHRHAVPGAVAHVHLGVPGAAIAHGFGQRAGCRAQQVTLTVAVIEQTVTATTAYNFVAQIAGDSLGAIVPEDDPPVPIHQVDPGLQAFQDSPQHFWALKLRHVRLHIFRRRERREL
jgi:hypothetical protein